MPPAASLGPDEILTVLASGAAVPLPDGIGVSQLDHALQSAALVARAHPGDEELAVAGLVHDLGHLLAGSTDETHAADAAAAVVSTLGPRVARAVGLHVAAKRYLVAVDDTYAATLGADSVASLAHQGGAMTEAEAGAFLAEPGATDAVALRRADDGAKVPGLVVGTLEDWAPLVRRVAAAARP